MSRFLILAIDGGGIRGIFAAKLLELITADHPFLPQVRLLAGTSTGSIITACLASDMPPEKITDLYRAAGPAIFSRKLIRPLALLNRASGQIAAGT